MSAGATSAVSGHMALRDYPKENIHLVYCETGSEHVTNEKFLTDCENWYDHPIERIKNPKYHDIYDVFEARKFMKHIHGAPCTGELKKYMRRQYEKFDDIQIFGFDAGEVDRAEKFIFFNPEVKLYAPLIEKGLTKDSCLGFLQDVGIELPFMYQPQKSGVPYGHNNCIGCVKGGMGYWNKIRIDFPEIFDKTAKLERKYGHSLLKDDTKGEIVYLDELDPKRGDFGKEPNMVCDMLCTLELK
jgi:hypothetical protein